MAVVMSESGESSLAISMTLCALSLPFFLTTLILVRFGRFYLAWFTIAFSSILLETGALVAFASLSRTTASILVHLLDLR